MTDNPYQAPSATTRDSSPESESFPFFSAGPGVGAAVGLAVVTSATGVWAAHDYPEGVLFRGPDGVFISAVLLVIGGAIFGLIYGIVLWQAMKSRGLVLRKRCHFYTALVSTLVVTVVTCELSLQGNFWPSPVLIPAVIVVSSFMMAIVTGRRQGRSKGRQS